jgi:hypothetical protein
VTSRHGIRTVQTRPGGQFGRGSLTLVWQKVELYVRTEGNELDSQTFDRVCQVLDEH